MILEKCIISVRLESQTNLFLFSLFLSESNLKGRINKVYIFCLHINFKDKGSGLMACVKQHQLLNDAITVEALSTSPTNKQASKHTNK